MDLKDKTPHKSNMKAATKRKPAKKRKTPAKKTTKAAKPKKTDNPKIVEENIEGVGVPDGINQNEPKKEKKPLHIAKKTVDALNLVVDHGLEPRRALMIATGNTNPHPNTVLAFRKKCDKWSIERPAAQKIAHSALVKFAAGKDVNGIEPKAVDVRASAERIIDQATPIIRRTENLNINAEMHPVDLERYRIR